MDQEHNVGIRNFLLEEGAQIKGTTKFRITDFVVNEINE